MAAATGLIVEGAAAADGSGVAAGAVTVGGTAGWTAVAAEDGSVPNRAGAATSQLGSSTPALVFMHFRDLAVGEEQDAVRHLLDAGVVGDDESRGPKLPVHAQERLDHQNPGLGIKGSGWLITE